MAEISFFGNFFRKFGTFIAFGLAGLGVYGGVKIIDRLDESFVSSKQKEEGMRRLERQVSDYEYDRALEIAQEMKDSNRYNMEELDRINSLVKGIAERKTRNSRNEVLSQLERFADNFDIAEAERVMGEITAEKGFLPDEISRAQNKFSSISEDALYQKTLVNGNDKAKNIDNFFRAYPNSPRRKKVVEELLFTQANKAYDNFRQGDFDRSYKDLVDLVVAMDKYSFDNPDLTRLQIERLVSEGGRFLESNLAVPKTVELGSLVRVENPEIDGWDEKYFIIRQAGIPRYSVGRITKITVDEKDPKKIQYSVFFKDIRNYELNKGEFSSSDNEGSKVRFYLSELKVLPPIDEFRAGELRIWLDKLNALAGAKK